MAIIHSGPGSGTTTLVDAGSALELLYENRFSGRTPQGRSHGPRGEGPAAADADSLVPFHSRVVVETLDDGEHVTRFPTRHEQPGGGNSYGWFASYVACRNSLVRDRRLYGWTVHLPASFDLDSRCSYYENRFIFSLGIEDRESHLGLRFDGDDCLLWTVGLQQHERVLGRMPLVRPLRGLDRLRCTTAVDFQHGGCAVAIEDQHGAMLAQSVAPEGFSLERTTVAVLSSGGNTSADNDDSTRFCRLGHVTVHRVMARLVEVIHDDGDVLVPPDLVWGNGRG